MGITVSATDGGRCIGLEGAIDIASAAELKAALLEGFETGREVRVSLAGAGSLDVTVVQLLWAAVREAKRLGVEFVLEERAPEAMSGLMASMGLEALDDLCAGSAVERR